MTKKRLFKLAIGSVLSFAALNHAAWSASFYYTGGLQAWTVPTTGIYQITTYGAQGGGGNNFTGGLGGMMSGDFSLTAGELLSIEVGSAGATGTATAGGGGGGGSGVVATETDIGEFNQIIPYDVLLVVAGGGGGSGTNSGGGGGDTGPNWGRNGGGGNGVDGGGGGGYGGCSGQGGIRGGGGVGCGGGDISRIGGGIGGNDGNDGVGGGGGGGYSGGDGGAGGGGGGGGLYISLTATNVTGSAGSHSGNGLVEIQSITATPIPPAIWLVGSALAGLIRFGRRRITPPLQ